MKASIHGLFEKLKAGKPIASHEGDITSEIIEEFLTKVENSLSDAGESPKKIRKVYNILVEALQNLYHHQAVPPAALILRITASCSFVGFPASVLTSNPKKWPRQQQMTSGRPLVPYGPPCSFQQKHPSSDLRCVKIARTISASCIVFTSSLAMIAIRFQQCSLPSDGWI